jgi:hypothetical protein
VKSATIFSVCECQARLGAELDEHKYVKEGWAIDRRRHLREKAPAHSIHADRTVFQVAWFCPFCIRNTLRSFDTSALAYHEHADIEATPVTSASSG